MMKSSEDTLRSCGILKHNPYEASRRQEIKFPFDRCGGDRF